MILSRGSSSILDCEKPVVGAINGTAAGGGAQLVLACDLVVMADHARLIEVFVRRGIMPDAGGAYLLPRLIGLHRAKEIMFLGDDVSAQSAAQLGIGERSAYRLVDLYGTRAEEILALIPAAPTLATVVDPYSGAIAAEAAFAVQEELATSLADILLRRTMIAYGPHAGIGPRPTERLSTIKASVDEIRPLPSTSHRLATHPSHAPVAARRTSNASTAVILESPLVSPQASADRTGEVAGEAGSAVAGGVGAGGVPGCVAASAGSVFAASGAATAGSDLAAAGAAALSAGCSPFSAFASGCS